MSKKILIEVNVLSKFFNALFSAKMNGDEDKLDKVFAKTDNRDLQRAYDSWKRDSDRMVQSARDMVKKAGKDTSSIDAVIAKYRNF
jgi:predicted  nucleic acid-binding Zn-ribbon protein